MFGRFGLICKAEDFWPANYANERERRNKRKNICKNICKKTIEKIIISKGGNRNGRIARIFISFEPELHPMDGRIFHLKNVLSERLDHLWTVEKKAAGFELSPAHFHKLFKSHQGISPIAYVRDLRLEKARELIETTFIQMKQIGLKVGMSKDSHFTRDFKKKYGVTPTEYRKRYWETEQSVPPEGHES